jgi:hypothetical protein
MEQKVKIVKIGKADPKLSNIGHHEIGLNRGFIYIWFSDVHELKTAEEALDVANKIVNALNEGK